ncbi:tRNA (cytidine/uridine-2'-O-)-methyltransferase TrmJ OS=Afipia felis OX=1035 GN=trmJ PE=3 SV=1 [Afipia felis]
MKRLKSRARKLRLQQTSAEARLWQALRNRRLARWKFRRQQVIAGYIVDFITLDGKLVIEVGGVTHGTEVEIIRDRARTASLDDFGFHVVRVTNTDVSENLEGVLETIERTAHLD